MQKIPTDSAQNKTDVNAIASQLLHASAAKRNGDQLGFQQKISEAQLEFDKALFKRDQAQFKERQKLQKQIAESAEKLKAAQDHSHLVEQYKKYIAEGNYDAAVALGAIIKDIEADLVKEASDRDLIKGSENPEALKRGKFKAEQNPFEKARQAGLTDEEQKEAARIDAGLTGSYDDETKRQEAETKQSQAETAQYEAETERAKQEEASEKEQLANWVMENAETLGLEGDEMTQVISQILSGQENPQIIIDTLFEKLDELGLDPEEALKRKADIISAVAGVRSASASGAKETDFSATQSILDGYAGDVPNNTAFNSIANMIKTKDQRQTFIFSLHRFAKGRSFEELSKPENESDRENIGRLMVAKIMDNAPGGDIVKRHLRVQELLRVHLPEIMKTIDDLRGRGIDLGKFTSAAEKTGQFFGNTTNPEVAKLNVRIKDLVASFVALRSGAQVTEQERALYTDIFAQLGRGYELNKSVIDGLMTNVMIELGTMYRKTLGEDWGDYATSLDFQPGDIAPIEYVSPSPAQQPPAEPEEPSTVPGVDQNKVWGHSGGQTDDSAADVMKGLELGKSRGLTREQLDASLQKFYPDMSEAERKAFLDALE